MSVLPPEGEAVDFKFEAEEAEFTLIDGSHPQVETAANASGGRSIGYLDRANSGMTWEIHSSAAVTAELTFVMSSSNFLDYENDFANVWPLLSPQPLKTPDGGDIITFTVNGQAVEVPDAVVKTDEDGHLVVTNDNPPPEGGINGSVNMAWHEVSFGTVQLQEGKNTITIMLNSLNAANTATCPNIDFFTLTVADAFLSWFTAE